MHRHHRQFFEIGGDSIVALQIVVRARAAGPRITPKQLLERQTIATLALVAEETAPGAPTTEAPGRLLRRDDVAALADRLAAELERFAGDRTAMWDVPQ